MQARFSLLYMTMLIIFLWLSSVGGGMEKAHAQSQPSSSGSAEQNPGVDKDKIIADLLPTSCAACDINCASNAPAIS
jgi:hypothetical protein